MEKIPNIKEEIDWKDLIRKPEKLFGFSYLYFLLIIISIGLLYIWNLNNVGRNSISPQAIADSSKQEIDIPLQSPRRVPPIDIFRASIPSQSRIERGKELFSATCSACHGNTGHGDGPSAAMLNPKPRNFNSLAGWTNGSKISQIYKTLETGIAGTGMSSFNYMLPEDKIDIILFIRTLTQGQPIDSPEELRRLDAEYKLSSGLDIAGQIPVSKAMIVVEREENTEIKNTISAVNKLRKLNTTEAEFLKQVICNDTVFCIIINQMKIKNISESEFIKTVSANPIGAGFKTSVNMLSEKQWSALFQFVNSVNP